ncbi:sm protein LSM2 [Trifolium repens]|nr:sm protein LSM2 [Trifolium repens]
MMAHEAGPDVQLPQAQSKPVIWKVYERRNKKGELGIATWQGRSVRLSVRNCFIRGSVVRYVQLPPEGVDIELLHDATRREKPGVVDFAILVIYILYENSFY